MDDWTGTAGGMSAAVMAVQAYAAGCAAAAAWAEAPATRLVALLGPAQAAEIEALRDAAAPRQAIEPWAAATARALMAPCEAIVECGTQIRERTEWEEDEDGRFVEIVVGRDTLRTADAEAAAQAARELMVVAEAIERCLDIEAAMERYGLPGR